ncbi:MAG: CotH kinase family protein [Lachnospiraceae bacterium]|nr:CotH kinase family protein [Lachnospiraceae bacterium]
MSTNKHIDKICCITIAVALVLTIIFMNAGQLGVQAMSTAVGYASRLFNTSTVHSIDIVMDDWDSFIENCANEEYVNCTVIIDGEAYRNVGIRAKGNTSLTAVESYGNNRYSFKIEFDHYDDGGSYYGLDKLCLNNIIQDNTYMKDYLTYQLMREFGADAPLCSYSYITVNGDDWGLYLAVEGVEEAFLQRNYGSDYGQLYKPDSMDMGGGRGNGRGFDMENFDRPFNRGNERNGDRPFNDFSGMKPEEGMNSDRGMGGGRSMGSSDVSLIYSDDEFDSYSNIFDNAKTSLTDADKTRLISSLKEMNNGENIESVVNIQEVIRYFVVHNFVLNFDSYTGSMIHNYYLYEDEGLLSMIPWDYNLAFGGFQSQSDATDLVNYPIDTPVSGGTIDSRPMLAWIFGNEEYTELYHQYFAEFITQYFDSGYFADMIDTVSEMISPYVESDPTKFCTYEEFKNGVATLREFCLLRAESVNGQLNGTIPSTSDGQSQDSSAFIDASNLVISDMGDMGNMMGGGMHEQRR